MPIASATITATPEAIDRAHALKLTRYTSAEVERTLERCRDAAATLNAAYERLSAALEPYRDNWAPITIYPTEINRLLDLLVATETRLELGNRRSSERYPLAKWATLATRWERIARDIDKTLTKGLPTSDDVIAAHIAAQK